MSDTEKQQMTANDKPEKVKKIRILALCDSPTSATGFAQVSRNILQGLMKTGKYEIDVIGINYNGDYYDRVEHPYNIYPAMPMGYSDMYGRGRLLNAINGVEEKFGLKRGWDIIFTIQDPFIIEGLGINVPFGEQMRVTTELWKRTVSPDRWYTWIGYFPVDSDLKENWVTRSIALADHPIAYCEWAKDKMMEFDREKFETEFHLAMQEGQGKRKAKIFTPPLKDRVKVIHHGVETNLFFPISEEERQAFRKEYFPECVKPDTYLIVNVSRNQPRKDISRTMAAFAEFKKQVPNSHLYLHCKPEDAGGSILEMARNFKLSLGVDYSVPVDFNAGVGYPIETVNKIYNAADLCVTTTLGEGWGFITTEAMATKTPILAPNITSILDIFGSYVPVDPNTGTKGEEPGNYDLNDWLFAHDGIDQVRGIPVKAGSTSSEWICMGLEDNERIRPLTNIDDMVMKMKWAYENPERVKAMTERAYKWVQGITWDKIVNKWDDVFMGAFMRLQEMKTLGRTIDSVGRNEPCPCGSGRKFKKCHGSTDQKDKYRDWIGEAEVSNDIE